MKDPSFAKSVVFVNALVPLGLLMWDGCQRQLGADPVNYAIHVTGNLALIFLFLSLCVTPLRFLTGKNWLSHFRRMLGLYAFFYGCVHLLVFFVFNRGMSIPSFVREFVHSKFIFYGSAALVLMIPLAVTSTNDMIKRLGAARWKRLHQLAYISAILGMVHYYISSKVVSVQQIGFMIALVLLLGFRVGVKFGWISKSKAKPQAPARSAPAA